LANIAILGVKKADNRALFRRAAHWISDRLLGDRLSPNVNINIIFCEVFDKSGDGILAYCEWLGDASIRPRDFEIQIDNDMSIREQLKAMVHEIVHVKQYSRNELYDYQRDTWKSRWHKQIVIRNDKVTLKRYKSYPWEKEAYEAEVPMLKMFLQETGIDLRRYKKK